MLLPGQSSLGSIRRGVLGLLSDRLGVCPIDKKRHPNLPSYAKKESPHAAGALHDTPSGLLPFQKVAVRDCNSMPVLSLSKLVVAVKLYYTPFSKER